MVFGIYHVQCNCLKSWYCLKLSDLRFLILLQQVKVLDLTFFSCIQYELILVEEHFKRVFLVHTCTKGLNNWLFLQKKWHKIYHSSFVWSRNIYSAYILLISHLSSAFSSVHLIILSWKLTKKMKKNSKTYELTFILC